MTLAPLLAAPSYVIVHAVAAMAAFVLGLIQLAAPKGTLPHRTIGWIWVILMAVVAASSFLIHTICTFGPFSIIHGLSLVTLIALPMGVAHARAHRVGRHKRTMTLLFAGALVVAGIFTLSPGRIMHDVVFGTVSTHGDCTRTGA
ncbi:MAG: DUF2306 domain-containing protein [Limimaricola sp.]|uniref:DUF2306 domain-containing protein n=1 Tax=Limimaricola sp. TaxID=2211665 RepID=UPI001DA581ED|nr:DUF2306 domain-containing protein [Limimaricola sp.]MBI1418957.1 DUF2306 domain-containing protein [Limimaricola sp.]